MAELPTCCVTGAIPGDGGACGDCDPCLFGEATVPDAVKRLIAEKNGLLHRVGELSDELDRLQTFIESLDQRYICTSGTDEDGQTYFVDEGFIVASDHVTR